VIFRQLFDAETSTYSYLLADADTREAVLIDPVREQLERDLQLLDELELQLVWSCETHVHADHVTSAARLREHLGCRLVVGVASGVARADVQVSDGELIRFGSHALEARATPGHTAGCVTYLCASQAMAFTGDTLLVRACGRTDFQEGDARALYRSVHDKIFILPEQTKLYPAHDYRGHTMTTVAEEKRFNPRLGGGRGIDAFVALMDGLELPYPRRMDEAVPANLESGAGAAASGEDAASREDRLALQRMASRAGQDPSLWLGTGI
jgi:glyoxylase-like metal-dependent hydrolase (beta-lactamase superfamily II)